MTILCWDLSIGDDETGGKMCQARLIATKRFAFVRRWHVATFNSNLGPAFVSALESEFIRDDQCNLKPTFWRQSLLDHFFSPSRLSFVSERSKSDSPKRFEVSAHPSECLHFERRRPVKINDLNANYPLSSLCPLEPL